MFQNMTDIDFQVHKMRLQENVARAETFHSLFHDVVPARTRPVAKPRIQLPRLSLVRRLTHALPRPA